MHGTRVVLVAATMFVAACASLEAPLTKYSYTGPTMTAFSGVVSPWTTESRLTGFFIVPELPPSTTTDFLDPDIDWPIPHLPPAFTFSDGARFIHKENVEEAVKDTGLRIDPNVYEVRTFSVRTDASGNIVAWDILFVHDVRRSTFLTAHNGGIYGQDMAEVDATHFGCVATEKCTAHVNYTHAGPGLPGTSFAGSWTKAAVVTGKEDL